MKTTRNAKRETGNSELRLSSTVKVSLVRVRGGHGEPAVDRVATEEPLEIRVIYPTAGGLATAKVSVTMRTPGDDFELAAGFLFTEGIVRDRREIARVAYCLGELMVEQQYNIVSVELAEGAQFDPTSLARNFYATSSCGVCGKASLESIRAQGCAAVRATGRLLPEGVLCGLGEPLRRSQAVFKETGGLHAAGLFDFEGRLLVLREDVGRHNAVDKVVGTRFLAGELPLEDRVLMVSGRASFEIMQKAAMAGIPVVAAVGAPSSLAVATARDFGMTLVGFLRPDGLNVYAGADRLAVSAP